MATGLSVAVHVLGTRAVAPPDRASWWCRALPAHSAHRAHVDLLYVSTSFLWWQAVRGIIGVTSSTALRSNSRCPWRPREGARNVYHTAIRRALSPWRPCGSVPADVQGCPRGVAPIRHPRALRDTPVAHTGGATTPSPHHATGCAARPSLLFAPPGHGLVTRDARWKLLI